MQTESDRRRQSSNQIKADIRDLVEIEKTGGELNQRRWLVWHQHVRICAATNINKRKKPFVARQTGKSLRGVSAVRLRAKALQRRR